jgi:hypothetical protein
MAASTRDDVRRRCVTRRRSLALRRNLLPIAARVRVALFGGFMQDAVANRAKLPVCRQSQAP